MTRRRVDYLEMANFCIEDTSVCIETIKRLMRSTLYSKEMATFSVVVTNSGNPFENNTEFCRDKELY